MNKLKTFTILIICIFLFLASFTQVSATTLATVDEALQIFMPEAESIKEDLKTLTETQIIALSGATKLKFDPILDKEFKFYIGKSNGQILGYAVDHSVKGKWGLIHYILLINADGAVENLMVLEYGERRGKPVAKRRFLKQFFGKTIKNRIKLKKDIRGVSGATISSKGVTNGVKKLLHVHNEFYLKSYESN